MVPFQEIFTGYRCNQQCSECQARLGGAASLSSQEILAAMDEVPAPREGISFYGGEPLLRSDLLALIQAARHKGFRRIRLRTNAKPLGEKDILRQLLEAGCHHFEVKLMAADPRIHDAVTGQPGNLEKSWAGLRQLRQAVIAGTEAEHPFLSILIPLRLANTASLVDTILALMPLKPDRIVLCWQISEQPFSQVLPHIYNAINLSLLNRCWIVAQQVPLCQMPGFEAHVAELYTTLPAAVCDKLEQCGRCLYNDFCPGIPRSYLEAQGGREIRPVLDSGQLEDISRLVKSRTGPYQELTWLR